MGSPILQQVLDRIRSAVDREVLPLIVFDLDSTLFSTRSRNLRILRSFAEDRRETFPELLELADSLQASDFGYKVTGPLEAAGVLTEELQGDLLDYWAKRFFTDRYCQDDDPIEGAAEFVRLCHEAGGLIYYLTGRHVGGMEHGTLSALIRCGFPCCRGRVELHLKPDFHMPDGEFKNQAVEDIRSHGGEVVATFENEPGHANRFADCFPGALHFLLETVHSPTAPAPGPALISSDDFLLG